MSSTTYREVITIATLKKALTDYGISVKVELLKKGVTLVWLEKEIKRKLPDKYIDHSVLNRVLTGQLNSKDIIGAINEILNIT